MNLNNKRKRCGNYSTKEVETLITLVEEFKEQVECKKTDHISCSQKEKAWQHITQKFNNIQETGRSKENLKSKWDSLKKITRKELAAIKKGFRKTGGFPGFADVGGVGDRMLAILGIHATGMESRFDCEAIKIEVVDEEGHLDIIDERIEEQDSQNLGTFLIAENIVETPSEINVLNEQDTEETNFLSAHEKKETLKKPKTDAPLISEENKIANSRVENKALACRSKKRKKVEKQVYIGLVEKKLELIQLQKEILQKEWEEKRRQNIEKHLLEVEILTVELECKKKQLQKM